MNSLSYGFRLATWAVEFAVLLPFLYWPFTLGLIGVMMATGYWWSRYPPQRRAWRSHYWLVFSHLLFFVFAIGLGAARPNPQYPGTPHHRDELGLMFLQVLWYGSWMSCAFWIWRMRNFRWIAALLLLGTQFLVGGALFIAGMSITGDWI
jgi:hypothetical protein